MREDMLVGKDGCIQDWLPGRTTLTPPASSRQAPHGDKHQSEWERGSVRYKDEIFGEGRFVLQDAHTLRREHEDESDVSKVVRSAVSGFPFHPTINRTPSGPHTPIPHQDDARKKGWCTRNEGAVHPAVMLISANRTT